MTSVGFSTASFLNTQLVFVLFLFLIFPRYSLVLSIQNRFFHSILTFRYYLNIVQIQKEEPADPGSERPLPPAPPPLCGGCRWNCLCPSLGSGTFRLVSAVPAPPPSTAPALPLTLDPGSRAPDKGPPYTSLSQGSCERG